MSTFSTIKITFTEDLSNGAVIGFDIQTSTALLTGNLVPKKFSWVLIRSGSYQVTSLGFSSDIPGERTAINFVTAFNLDTSNNYVVTRIGNEVTIRSNNSFGTTTKFYVRFPTWDYSNPASVQYVINNNTIYNIAIDSLTFSQATTETCQKVKVNVHTTKTATKILSPVTVNGNSANPYLFDWLRGTTITVKVQDADGTTAEKQVKLPNLLAGSNYGLQITNSPNGSTVVVNEITSSDLDLQYSLDGSTWKTDNYFNGLADGDYTLIVKDSYGCSFTKDFTISNEGIYEPYFYISKANSIRFAQRVNWDNAGVFKTDENTLSCEALVNLPYKETQLFQNNDIITTQFKSNFATKAVKVIREDLSEVNLPVTQKSNNIGVKDKRDARKYEFEDGKTGIYFISGHIYDYDTDIVADDYALNGSLPVWAVEGNYISFGGAWFQIEEIAFDQDKNAEVIVYTANHSGAEASVIVGSVYNRFNYEIFEFDVSMADFDNETFNVKIENEDPNFGTVSYLSEQITTKVVHDKTVEICYKNSSNTDVFYGTGIEHKIRIPYLYIKGKDESNSEIYKTDTDSQLISAEIYESEEFVFQPVTKEIWRKLKIALSHEQVFINGIGYVKNADFNTEGPLNDSNLYVLTATMIKTGIVYNSMSGDYSVVTSENVEMPGLIDTGNGYMKY